jgi:hypothetical protein
VDVTGVCFWLYQSLVNYNSKFANNKPSFEFN